mmetsp:Transcript_51992/g.161349  ORF Transcript_51992/g.161349 Transcript_51992/m.161349 type:complete len:869 (-) Transcript_51992:176-2782(-)
MFCSYFQSVASDSMSAKASKPCSANTRKPITFGFLAVCGACVLARVLDHIVFGEEDGVTSELCAFAAFAVGAAAWLRQERHRTQKGAKSAGSRDGAARRTSEAESGPRRWSGGRRQFVRQGAAQAASGPRRSYHYDPTGASHEEMPTIEVDASLVGAVLTDCSSGNTVLADEHFSQLLKTIRTSTGSSAAAADGSSGAPNLPKPARSSCCPPQPQAQAMVDACVEAKDMSRAADWFLRLHAVGLFAGSKSLLTLMGALAVIDHGKEAITFYKKLLEAGLQADAACFLVIFERCTSPGDNAAIEAWLEHTAQRSPFEFGQAFVALLRSKSQTRDAQMAEAWMAKAMEAGALPSVQLYNGVIHACARAGDTDRAELWLKRMEEAAAKIPEWQRPRPGEPQHPNQPRLDPDVISYSAIMDACAQHGETERAEGWFHKMVAAGISPDTVSFNTMIKAHARGGDLNGAERWLQMAREKGARLDAFGYNAVIAAAARALDPEKAEWWLHQMLLDNSEPDVVSYNSVINAWAKKGDAAGAQRLVGLMCEKDVEPDVVTLGVAVHACAKAGDMARAEAIFHQIVSRGKTQPDAIGYNALINAAVKANDTTRAEYWLSAMLENGVAPSVVSYTTVLHAHARAGNIEKAEEGLERMLKDGIEANVVSYSALIHACVKAGDVERAEKWFKFMRTAGIQANTVSYSVLLNVCAKAGDHQRAEKWLQTMYEDKMLPNVVCYNNVIDACAKAGVPERAEEWLRHLTGEKSVDYERAPGLAPTRQSYTTAAQAYASQGMFIDVERLLAEMEERGIIMDEFSLTVLLSAYSRARPRKRERAEGAFRDYVARGLTVTKPPLRVLRSIVGGQRFEKLLTECNVQVA